jgi:hypothetical protein
MKKNKLWIFILLIAGLSLFLLSHYHGFLRIGLGPQLPNEKQKMELRFVVIGDPAHLSLDPIHSDFVSNAVRLEQMVGNLVKEIHGNTGKPEPYLAEKWVVSEDGKTWDFQIRPGLFCEDGTPIDADSFKRSLSRTLRRNLKQHDVPAFNQLVGWDDFKKGASSVPSGIKALSSEHLQLKFASRPHGLLEFLGMPQFGLHCDANFDGDDFRKNGSFISSGAYKLLRVDSGGTAIMEKRANWISANPAAPTKLKLEMMGWDAARALDAKRTIILHGKPNDGTIDGFTKVKGAPIFLSPLVLTHKRDGIFRDVAARRLFMKWLRYLQQLTPHKTTSAIHGKDFYMSFGKAPQTFVPESSSEPQKLQAGEKVLLLTGFPENLGPDVRYVLDLVTEVLRRNSIQYRVLPIQMGDAEYVKAALSNEGFDIRFAPVDIGGNPENWVIKMMFCSQLGVSFPDPSGRVCALANSFERNPESLSDEEYLERFNQIIEEDAAVIPMFHDGMSWFFSKDIDLSTVSSNLVVPRLEWLGLK